MFEADAGSGYAGTNWASRDVAQIWQAIENQDTHANYELLTGWRRSHELVWQHLEHVQSYRENLAAAWPPAKSAAAAAYIERLDHLIAHLQDTYRAAVTNYQVLYATTLAIAQARTSVQAIYSEYASNQAKLSEYHNTRPTVTSKYPVPPPRPPVPDGRQEELTNRARAIMYGLSNELLQARDQIANPPIYDPRASISDQKVTSTRRDMVTPTSSAASHGGSVSFGSQSGPNRPDGTPGTLSSSATESVTTAANVRQPNLVLNSFASPPAAPDLHTSIPAGPSTPPINRSISANPSQATSISGYSPIPILTPGSPSQPPKAPRTKPFTNSLGNSNPQATRTGNPVMPPGGVIGGSPTIGRGRPVTGTRPPMRPNPVGGVINAPTTGDRKTGIDRNFTAASQPMLGTQPRRVDQSDSGADYPDQDLDNPWETAGGVAPVVTPSGEQRVDPGPAIGLQ